MWINDIRGYSQEQKSYQEICEHIEWYQQQSGDVPSEMLERKASYEQALIEWGKRTYKRHARVTYYAQRAKRAQLMLESVFTDEQLANVTARELLVQTLMRLEDI